MYKRSVLVATSGFALAAAGIPVASGAIVHAVTQQQHLVTWDTATPGVILSGVPIQGMQPNELVMGMDSHGPEGDLYVLGSFNQLYRLDKGTAVATAVGDPMTLPPGGANFGFDINQATDRIRVVSNTNRNYSFAIGDGSMVTATDLAYAAGDLNFGIDPNIVHCAYLENSMTLYDIDTSLDVLVQQNNGAGQLTTVGALGADLGELGGFDILEGIGYLAGRDNQLSRSTFYTVNLATGAVTTVGQIAGGEVIVAMTVTPAPGSALIAGIGALIVFGRRR